MEIWKTPVFLLLLLTYIDAGQKRTAQRTTKFKFKGPKIIYLNFAKFNKLLDN